MKRQYLSNGRWFDRQAATSWHEKTYHDGHNFVSLYTRDQWTHATLYRTSGGRWVLHQWSDWQGGFDEWDCIEPSTAMGKLEIVEGAEDES